MGLLRTKERSPAAEAERQSKILTEIEHQRQQRADAERALSYENARRRQAMWEQAEQDREARRMQLAASELQIKRDREARQRENEAKLNQQKITEYRSAKEAFDSVKRELDGLNVAYDLSTPDGLAAATEQKLRATALRELLAEADRRLIVAERGIGRHRGGG